MALEGTTTSHDPHVSAWTGLIAAGLALVATLWFLLWPCSYRAMSTPAGVGPQQQTCLSFLGENGAASLFVLLIPLALTVLGMLAVRGGKRRYAWALGILDLAFCLVASASVGLWYLPSAIALSIGAATTRPDRR